MQHCNVYLLNVFPVSQSYKIKSNGPLEKNNQLKNFQNITFTCSTCSTAHKKERKEKKKRKKWRNKVLVS